MYRYDGYDATMLEERVIQFRSQTNRYLEGKLTDAEFLPLRLQNGLYVQRLAPPMSPYSESYYNSLADVAL